MTTPARPVLILGAVALVLIALAGWQRQQVTEAQAEARGLAGVAKEALQREAQSKAGASADATRAAEWERKAQAAQDRLDALPSDPGPRPVNPGSSAQAALSEMSGLGLRPAPLADPLACGLTLPDTLTTITWGREAQRVGPLAARLETSTALARALEGATGALHSQVSDLTAALGACDDRAAAEQRRADALDRALKAQGSPRNWTAGALLGLDTDGQKHLGAYVSWSYKAVDFHALTIHNTVALGAGYRF